MHIQLENEITINAPASKTWQVLADDFGNIGDWASIIVKSKPVMNDNSGNGNVSGRICTAKGFGDTEEVLTHYDDNEMYFTYKAIKGLPFFIKKAENNWSVRVISETESSVKSRAEIEMSFIPGFFIAPIFKLFMKKEGNKIVEELKYFLENNSPHPRKSKYQKGAKV